MSDPSAPPAHPKATQVAPAAPPGQSARVWILGGGLIGRGWAAAFAGAGHQVAVIDPDPQTAQALAAFWERAFANRAAPPPPLPTVHSAPPDGPAPDWVQENLPERLALKQAALAALAPRLGPRTIIASSSSGLAPADIAAGLPDPGRVIIAHPCNPPHLMPVVELCGTVQTPPAVLDRATAMLEGMGKTVLRMNHALPGHLVNRLQAALWREAVHLAREGVASLGDIERAVTLGLAPRWTLMGPSAVFHVAGGPAGMAGFLDALGPEVERWWDALGTPRLDVATRAALIAGMAEADPRPVAEIAAARDAALPQVLDWLAARRAAGWQPPGP